MRDTSISNTIKSFLDNNHMTMKEFARRTGLSYSTIRNYCLGKTYPDFFTMLLIYQNTDLDLISDFNFTNNHDSDEFKKLYEDAKSLHKNLGELIRLMEKY